MAGNRVEELEAKVRELEATIDGLTDELVETKERLQAIEEETGVGADALSRRSVPARERETEEADVADEEPTDDAATESADDVNSEESEGEDNADSESGDDIIVA